MNKKVTIMFEIGSKYANWEVLSLSQRTGGKLLYRCKCSCGNISLVRTEVLRVATSKNCNKCRFNDVEIRPGDKFGKWIVLQEVRMEEKRKHFIVRCDGECGFIRILKGIRLRFGDSVACRRCGSKSHGLSQSKTYSTWESMVQRCTNPRNRNYKHYGGRGIKVCEEWIDFDNFLSHMGERPENKELDRINNDGNYEKNNCRWITHKENLLNKRRE